MGKYVNHPYPYSDSPHEVIAVRTQRNQKLVKRIVTRYGKYRDCYRIGRPPFTGDEHVSGSQRMINWTAKLAVTINRSKLTPVTNPDFRDRSS